MAVCFLKRPQFWCAVIAYALIAGLGYFIWTWNPYA
jgi:hypothetical protein